MASRDLLKTRELLKKAQVLMFGTDGPVAIRIRNKAGSAVTSVVVTTATNIVLTDADGATTSTFATDTTLGKVVSRINSSSHWEAKLLDGLSSQLSTSTLLNGSITAGTDGNGNVVYDVLQDTSTALEIGCCLSPFRDFDAPQGHRVNLKKIIYNVDVGTAAADSAQLYLRRGGVETKIFGILSVDGAATTIWDFTAGPYSYQSRDNDELFFRVKDAATLADATANYVQVIGEIE